MNIQNYILPEWKKEIKNQSIPDDIQHKFIIFGESMAEYLDRFMMRSLPENWYRGWTRYQFPLDTDSRILDMHEVIAKNFGIYVKKYREGEKESFDIVDEEIEKIQQLEDSYKESQDDYASELDEIRSEISKLRKTREKRPKKPKKKKLIEKKAKQVETTKSTKKLEKSEENDPATSSSSSGLDHDTVYKKWMEMVESKPISKSYWHIHEYMSRYILEFADKNTEDGIITEQVIEDFLADYGKGKRPKTMNHYNRVVYRFWDFYNNLANKQDDPMEVW